MRNEVTNFLDKTWFLLFLTVAITFAIYSFKLSAPFDGMDDQVLIVDNGFVQNLSNVKDVFKKPFFTGGNYYRPAVLLSHMVEFKLFGLDAFYYNLNNILVHLLNVILVFFLSKHFFQAKIKAFWVCLLFAIHPINWEAVAMISGRPILLCTFFFLMSVVSYIRFLKNKYDLFAYGVSIICFAIGLFCKEEVVVVSAVLMIYQWLWGNGRKEERLLKFIHLLPFAFILAGYFLWRQWIHLDPIVYWKNSAEIIKGVMTFGWGLVEYLKTFFLPLDIYYDRSEKYITHFSDLRFGITALILIAVISLCYSQRFHMSRKVKFFLWWIFITLLPVSQIIPINVQIGSAAVPNHFFYLPSIGIFILVINGLAVIYERLQEFNLRLAFFSRVLLQGMVIFFLLITVKQNIMASDPIGVFEQTLIFEPDNIRVRQGAALKYAFNSQWDEAERQFHLALKYDPGNIGARINLGRVLLKQKRYEEADFILKNIKDPGPFADLLKFNQEELKPYIQCPN